MNIPLHLRNKFHNLLVLAIGIATFGSLFPLGNKFLQLWEAYATEFMLILLAGSMLFFIFNERRLMITCIACCAMLCFFLNIRTNAMISPAENITGGFQFRAANIAFPDEPIMLDTFLCSMVSSQADLLSIQNIPPAQLYKVHACLRQNGYPHFQIEPDRKRHRETAVYSRHAFDFVRIVNDQDMPGIVGRMKLPLEDTLLEIRFATVSLDNGGADRQHSADLLRSLSDQLGPSIKPLLTLGEFDQVPWSFQLQTFKDHARLRDSRRGGRALSSQGFFNLFQKPTQHIMHSDQFKCVSFEKIKYGSLPSLGVMGIFQLELKDNQHVQKTPREL